MANTFLRQLLAFEFPFCDAFGMLYARRKEISQAQARRRVRVQKW